MTCVSHTDMCVTYVDVGSADENPWLPFWESMAALLRPSISATEEPKAPYRRRPARPRRTEYPCEIDRCDGVAGRLGTARGMCASHYNKFVKYGDPLWERTFLPNICAIEGCEKPRKGRAWCAAHYDRWRRNGDPVNRKSGEIRDGKRICPRCGIDKLLDEWGKRPGRKSGLAAYCKSCTRAITAQWRKENEHNKELWYEARRRYYAVNREAYLEYSRQWRRENPEKVRAQAAQYRARKSVATTELISPAEIFERDGWQCQLCFGSIDPVLVYPDPKSASLDHRIPLSRGGAHLKDNCQAAHLTCNLHKHANMEVKHGRSVGDSSP